MQTIEQEYYDAFVDSFLHCHDFYLSLFEKTIESVAEKNAANWRYWQWDKRITEVQTRLDRYYDDKLLTSYVYQELSDYLRFAGSRIINFLLD